MNKPSAKRSSSNSKPTHAQMTQFHHRDNELLVNGLQLTCLSHRIGQTPYYAYDRSVIDQQINHLRKFFPAIKLHYAVKANPMPALVNHVAPRVDGLDVASAKELRVALDSGHPVNQISFAGPGKTENELLMAIASQITINVESLTELQRLVKLKRQTGYQPNVAVRLNPDFELKTSGMKMSGGAQQFGIDVEQLPNIMSLIEKESLNFHGFHIFTGSQNLNPLAICEAHNSIFELAAKLASQFNKKLKTLNIGGGFGITYFPGDQPLDIQPIAENLNRLQVQYKNHFLDTDIILELGRYIVGPSGIYVSKVTDIKTSRGETFVITNGGLHHHLAASGNFGQVIRKNYPVSIGNKVSQENTQTMHIVGPLCTPLDFLGKSVNLPKAEIGDLVVIYQSGAYGYTASPKEFLSHPSPVEVLV